MTQTEKTVRGSVLQEWVGSAPWKCQSILLSGLRGPDNPNCPHVKMVTRWMRSISQHNADTSTDYMRATTFDLPSKEAVEGELEYLVCHFVHHFADALRVIAIYCHDGDAREYARTLHTWIAEETFHFHPESDVEFIHRHRDRT